MGRDRRAIAAEDSREPVPRVAIIVPCYNDGQFVIDAVESISETEPIELIIVDDGSTNPETLAVLDQLRQSGFTVLRQTNGGPASAVQAGIDASSAAYVLRLDADDLLEPGVAALMADVLDGDSDLGLVFGDFEFFGDAHGVWRAPAFCAWTVMYGNFWSPTCLFRRSALDSVGGFAPSWRYEDWQILIRLAHCGWSGLHVGCIVYRRRLLPGRLQSKDRAHHREIYRGMRREHAEFFARRREFVGTCRPKIWQRALYPLVLGPRYALPEPVYRVAIRAKLWLGKVN